MTERECAIVQAYTGYCMLAGEKYSIAMKYIEDIMGRPVWSHELADKKIQLEIHEKSAPDFLDLCAKAVAEENRILGEWLLPNKGYDNKLWRKCSCCNTHYNKFTKYVAFNGEVTYFEEKANYCKICGAKMIENN